MRSWVRVSRSRGENMECCIWNLIHSILTGLLQTELKMYSVTTCKSNLFGTTVKWCLAVFLFLSCPFSMEVLFLLRDSWQGAHHIHLKILFLFHSFNFIFSENLFNQDFWTCTLLPVFSHLAIHLLHVLCSFSLILIRH